MTCLIRLAVVTSLLLMGGLAQAQQSRRLCSSSRMPARTRISRIWTHCSASARLRDATGFDPSQRPQASSAPPPDESSSTGRSAAGGAALGAAAGALHQRQHREAVLGGAAAGGLLGGARSSRNNRRNDQRQQQWEQQQMAEYNRNRSNWNRAFAGCMESRGYTVS